MKKLLVLTISCLLLLVGCNDIKNVATQEFTIQQAVDQISSIVDKRNNFETKIQNSPLTKAYDESITNFEKSMDSGDTSLKGIDQILANSEKVKKELAASKVTLQEFETEAQKMKTTLKSKLSKEDNVAVQKTLDHLVLLVTTEMKYIDTSIKTYKELDKMYIDIKNDKVPVEEPVVQVEKEMANAEKQLDETVNVFNQSWNALHKNVRGAELEGSK